MAVSLEQFAENLVQSGLFSQAELAAFREALPPDKRPQDAQGLARELIHAGKLTKYQAGLVYQRKTQGLVLGEYVVLDEIGAGGMGQVFKARHRTMERIVGPVAVSDASDPNAPPGTVLDAPGDRIVVAAGEGAVVLETLQPAGKRLLEVREFLRGYRVQPGERFGPE